MAKQQHQVDSALEGAADPAKPGRIAGLRAAITKRMPRLSSRAKIGIGVTLLLLIINGAILSIWAPKLMQSATEPRATLPKALAALDRRAFTDAKYMAAALQQSSRLDPADHGGPSFVIGAALAQEAELLLESDQNEMYRTAARYLEDARDRGFPQGRKVEGLFLLGKCLFATGDRVGSRTVLEQAFDADQELNTDAFQILASDYYSGAEPDDHKALAFIERYLSSPAITDAQRASALLLKARIQDRLGDAAASKKSLSQIPESSPSYAAALLFEAELLMREAQSADSDSSTNLYQQAIDKLDRARHDRSATTPTAMRCMYLIGVCEQATGRIPDALTQFQLVCSEYAKTNEAVAANFQIAKLFRRQGRDDESIAAFRQVVQSVGDPENYRNTLLPIDEVRKELITVYQQYLSAAKLDSVGQLARLLHPLFPPERELQLQGELLRAAAISYRSKAEGASSDEAKILAAKARANSRQAATAFAKLAELHMASRSYTDDLWNAAESYFTGQDYRQAAQYLNLYLKTELRRRRATALLLLGESQLALGETAKGVAALNECIDVYADDPDSFRARMLLAKTHQEVGENNIAEKLLRSNLEDGKLTPRSIEWRDSLFALASLMEIEGRYQEAIPRLEEAVARYPDAPQTLEARHLTVEAYRRLAREVEKKIEAATVESARAAAAKQMQENLTSALDHIDPLQSLLVKDRGSNTSPLEKAILRNCYFSHGAILYKLGRYEEAIRQYLTAANAYRNEPESLEALLQVAACYRELKQPVAARGSITQAKAALAKIDKNADFLATTNYSRDQWGTVLDRMATL